MISIARRFRPFSHKSGAKCLIPGTSVTLVAFPHRLMIGPVEVLLDNAPFARGFTLQQDLERNCVWVFGKEFRWKIFAKPDGIAMVSKKETKFFPLAVDFYAPKELERLSLGSNKAQDWDLVLRRLDLKEILPVLFFLSQKTAEKSNGSIQDFETFYLSSFQEMLVPQKEEETKTLFGSAFGSIRSLFFQEEGHHYKLLPNNPFPEGRLLNVQTEIGSWDLEWTKKKLRRATLRPHKTGEIFLDLPKGVVSFRYKKTQPASQSLFVEAGTLVSLDRFFE